MKGKKIVSTLLVLLLASLPVSAHAAVCDIGKGDITISAGSGGQTVTQGDGAAREPNRSPAKRVRFGKEEQWSERTVFFMQSIKIAASDT